MSPHSYGIDGERIDEDDEPQVALVHPETCRAGWLGENLDGSLIPCPVCRAETVRRLEAQRRRWSS